MIRKFLTNGYLKRLDNIKQWSERDVFNHESVSQHSFKVAVFTRVILEDIFGECQENQNEVNDFKLQCVTYALFHDFDEAIALRDLSHSVKYNPYNGDDIRKAIDNYVEYKFENDWKADETNSISDYDCDTISMLKHNIISPNPVVKKVVKVADWLGLLFFCRRELSLGNNSFHSVHLYCITKLAEALRVMFEALSDQFSISEEVLNIAKKEINQIIISDYERDEY